MKRFVSICLTSALLVSSTLSVTGFAKDSNEDKSKIQVNQLLENEKLHQPEFITGSLSLPSNKVPENIVGDYLEKKANNKDFVFTKKFKNDKKKTIVKTYQTYNGIKVSGTQQSYIINEDGVIETISGLNIPDIGSKIKGSIQINEKEALDVVKKDLKKGGAEFSHSSIEKIILPTDKDAVYTYKVNVSYTTPELQSWEYTINASTGKIIKKEDALRYESVLVDGKGVFGDTKSMNGYKGTIPDLNIVPTYPYSLADTTKTAPSGAVQRPLKVLTYEINDQLPINGNLDGTKTITSDNDGHFTEDTQKSHAVDAQYYTEKVYDFYKDKFGRYSYDNAGADIISNCHAIFGKSKISGYDKNNACWDGVSKQIYFGDGDNVTYYGWAGESDVTGHEFTHAVIGSEVDLDYEGEPGAINEGLADLFGESFEAYLSGTSPDWKKITKCYTPNIAGDARIDFKNPRNTLFTNSARAYPDHMNDKYNGSSDNCGVHVNAAILTKAFSLMSDGATFHNVSVTGIGLDKLTQIMYKVITEYLSSSNTSFNNFAEMSLNAAAAIYGDGSTEYKAVKAGFQAVGIPYNVSQWKFNSTMSDSIVWEETNSFCQVNNCIYSFGGIDIMADDFYSDVYEYNMDNNKWTKKNNMPKKRANSCSTSANGKGYVLFGLENGGQIWNGYYTTVDEYNPTTDQWRVASTLPSKQVIPQSQYTSGTILNKPITKRDGWFTVKTGQLATGASVVLKLQGSDDNINFSDYGDLGTFSTSFSTSQCCWAESDTLKKNYYRLVATVVGGTSTFEVTAPYIRDFSSITSYNGKLYIIGGQNAGTEVPILTMDVYDTVTNQWSIDKPGLSFGRGMHPVLVSAVINNLPKIFVFGGGSKNIEVYDINSDTWNHNAGTSPSIFESDQTITGVFYKGKIQFSNSDGETLIYDPSNSSWTENLDVGALSVYGINPLYQNSIYNISSKGFSPFAPLIAERYDPIRINAFDNNNAIVVQWSKFGNSSNILSIDGSNVYSGTGENYIYSNFTNASKKHLMKVTQAHPVYGSITSKNLCTVYQKIGDMDGNNVIDSNDVTLLKNAVLYPSSLTNLQKVAADVNKDNKVNSYDYSTLQRYVVNGVSNNIIGSIKFMIYGDVNDDGNIDYSDYDKVYNYVSSGSPLSLAETVKADVNGDGVINSIDASLINQYINNDNITFDAVNK